MVNIDPWQYLRTMEAPPQVITLCARAFEKVLGRIDTLILFLHDSHGKACTVRLDKVSPVKYYEIRPRTQTSRLTKCPVEPLAGLQLENQNLQLHAWLPVSSHSSERSIAIINDPRWIENSQLPGTNAYSSACIDMWHATLFEEADWNQLAYFFCHIITSS